MPRATPSASSSRTRPGSGPASSTPRPASTSRTAARRSASTPAPERPRAAQADRPHAAAGMLFRAGERRLVVGSMGGDIQPQIHVQLVSALVDGGADIRTAVAAPRVVVQPAGWFAPPVAVVADGELAPGVGRSWRPSATRSGGRRTTAASATSTRSSCRRRTGRGRDARGDRRPPIDGAGRRPLTPVIVRTRRPTMLSSAGRWQAALTPICCRHSSASRRARPRTSARTTRTRASPSRSAPRASRPSSPLAKASPTRSRPSPPRSTRRTAGGSGSAPPPAARACSTPPAMPPSCTPYVVCDGTSREDVP